MKNGDIFPVFSCEIWVFCKQEVFFRAAAAPASNALAQPLA